MLAKIDTLKVELPATVCKLDLSAFDCKQITKSNGDTVITYELNTPTTGIKQIVYRPYTDTVLLDISAKVLQNRYPELISLNTISDVVKNVSDTGLISFNVSDFIQLSNVHRIDYCNNIVVGNDLQAYIDFLSFVSVPNYQTTTNGHYSTVQSVMFKSKYKTIKDRLICYNKLAELKDTKANFNGLKLADFNGVLRVERNIIDKKSIRKITGHGTILADCLTINTLPNIDLLKRFLTEKTNTMNKVSEIHYKDQLAFEQLIYIYNGDTGLIRDDLKRVYSRATAYREYKKFIKYLKQRRKSDLTENLLQKLDDVYTND